MYGSRGRRRGVAGCIARDDLDGVLARYTINAADKTRAEADFLEVAIQVNVVANILLPIEVIGGLGPPQLELKVAVTERLQVSRGVRRGVVVGIGRQGRDRNGIGEGPLLIS